MIFFGGVNENSSKNCTILSAPLAVAMLFAAAPATRTDGQGNHAAHFYQEHNLVSDGFVKEDNNDPKLVNTWGKRSTPRLYLG